jgi:transcription antitermination protein NusB
MAGLRRKARIAALQALYEIDCSGHKLEEVLDRTIKGNDLPEQAANFSRGLVDGIIQKKQAIDDLIRRFAPLFPLEQIAIIDRNILRLAIFEILFDNQVPVKAAVNEAIELSKGFAGDSSPKFINGVLGSVIANSDVRPK